MHPTHKRHRSPGLHTVISDPELESHDDFRAQKRHVSEFMASDLHRHMSLASCSSGDQSMSAEGGTQASGARTSTPPLPSHLRQPSISGPNGASSLGRAASGGGSGLGGFSGGTGPVPGVNAPPLRVAQSMEQLDDSEWQLGMYTSDASLTTPRTSTDEQGTTPHAHSPALPAPSTGVPSGIPLAPVRAPSPSLLAAMPYAAGAPTGMWMGSGPGMATGMAPSLPHGAVAAAAGGVMPPPGAAGMLPPGTAPRTLSARARGGSESLFKSLSAGIVPPAPNVGPPITTALPLTAKSRQAMQRSAVPNQPQSGQDLMPPSPSDARFTFADLRKTALLRSLKQRTTEDAVLGNMCLGDGPGDGRGGFTGAGSGAQGSGFTASPDHSGGAPTSPTRRISASGSIVGGMLTDATSQGLIAGAVIGGPGGGAGEGFSPSALLMRTSSAGGAVDVGMDQPPSPAVPAAGGMGLFPPPRNSVSGRCGEVPLPNLPSLPRPQSASAGGTLPGAYGAAVHGGVGHHHHYLPYGKPHVTLPYARGSSPSARSELSWMDTGGDSDSSSSSGCGDDETEMARRTAPVCLRAEGIAPLPRGFGPFGDAFPSAPPPYHHPPYHPAPAHGRGHAAAATAAGFAPDAMAGCPDPGVLGAALVGTPAPTFSIATHVASFVARGSAGGAGATRLGVIPEKP